MNGWGWLTGGQYDWRFVGRVVLKALALFAVFNLAWLVLNPLPSLAGLSVYGWLVPYRERLPYGESSAASNLSTESLEAMFATHTLNQPKAADEFRVLVVGDSATWGILLRPAETTSGQLNALNLTTQDGRRIRFYNVAHPIMSLTKDLLLLEEARRYQPNMILWLNTLESFYRAEQLEPPLVQANADRVRDLVARYGLALDTQALPMTGLWDRSFIAQRRQIADGWRLQAYGLAWATTHVDQLYPSYTPRSNDFEADMSWKAFAAPTEADTLQTALAFDVITAAHTLMGDVPILLVNEPIYMADGQNSDLRYNVWYPQWAYDAFRDLYAAQAERGGWKYADLWNQVTPAQFTDSPVHLTADGTRQLVEALVPALLESANQTP